MFKEHLAVTVVGAATLVVSVPIEAQLAPEGAVADPTNPSSVTVTSLDKNHILKRVDHYYYDCLKKKWVWVSREWYRAPVGFESGEWILIPPGPGAAGVPGTKVPLAASPDNKELPSGPPPGAETSTDPDRAFNPTTGQNFAKQPDGSWIDVKTGKKILAPVLCPCPETPSTTPKPPPPENPPPKKLDKTSQRILDIHNDERFAVHAPPLKWNFSLAQDATQYVRQLAQTGQLVHAPREGRGIERENLSEGNVWWTTDQMMGNWLGEKRYFHPGIFPNVCTGDWSQCAHYSQMIWPTTTDVGCGEAAGSGHKWLVCRYSPGGNRDGKPVGLPPSN